VQWIDGRAHDFPAAVPGNVEVLVTDAPEDALAGAPRGAYVFVLTHSHALDYALIEAALRRDDWRYVGLIGSKSKRRQFEQRLAARGFLPAQLARITCPIGFSVAGVRSKEPGAIAVAAVAELLATRERAAASDGTGEAKPAASISATGSARRSP
jgi:xanthine dehydrogenase accessory factor